MSKISKENEMRSEYDFSKGVLGKHYRAYQEGSNVVFLEPDIAKVFKDSESVNHALRMLMELAGGELQKNSTKRST
jgi:hypothetical protein